ncbi:App1 family protein [Nodosilinea sp. AN01ver1]|uniref:App1 family protein n=1 Tax=Nodosilinea sp. AN01ver1 TaxID=3423362 RepID=UPI003D31429A
MQGIRLISAALGHLDELQGSVKEKLSDLLGLDEDPIGIMSYRGYGTPDHLHLRGRVLQDQGIKLREENASVWKNIRNMYRRFESDEVEGARLRAYFGNAEQEVVADDEGYFNVEFKLSDRPVEAVQKNSQLWQPIALELLEPLPQHSEPIKVNSEIMVVSERAQFGVISDIDDTIMHTAATDLLKMIRIAYLGNERTRRPFPGVAEFYRALQQGQPGGANRNPIFYVSSSAWNMYDLFEKFMDFNHIPCGSILLRDIELSPANLLSFDHTSHKVEQITPILNSLDPLPFILIGDSGQKDAWIYQRLLQDYPDRILAIYIRNVTPNDAKRQHDLDIIAQQVRAAGCEFVVFPETQVAIEHAIAHHWISEQAASD